MRILQSVIAAGAIVFALGSASAQAPLPQQSGKPSVSRQQPPHLQWLSGAGADDLVLESTGKSGVDMAAVKAREERDAESNQMISDGESSFKAGNIQVAISLYKDALDTSPTDGLAYQRLAEAYAAAGKLPEASQAFHKVLIEGFGPGTSNGGVGGSAGIWAEYALILVKTNETVEAIQAYNHAASLLDFEDSQYHEGRTTLKVLLPELVVERILPTQAQYTPEHLQALADTALAYGEVGFGSNKEARAHMLEAVKLYPDSAVTQYYLGKALDGVYYHTKEPLDEDKAGMIAAYKKAVELGDDQTAAAAKERLTIIR